MVTRPKTSGIPAAGRSPPRGKVLVVDDDPIALKLTRARLQDAGYEVVLRDQALGTSQAVKDENPDVVMLDLNMPALGGDALATMIKKSGRQVAVIFHSTVDIQELRELVKKTGALGAIQKTNNDALFLAQFERLFERSKRALTGVP